jgi:hypothetical protein
VTGPCLYRSFKRLTNAFSKEWTPIKMAASLWKNYWPSCRGPGDRFRNNRATTRSAEGASNWALSELHPRHRARERHGLGILTSRPAGEALGHRRKRISRTGADRPWSTSGESSRASISSAWLLSATTSSTIPSGAASHPSASAGRVRHAAIAAEDTKIFRRRGRRQKGRPRATL